MTAKERLPFGRMRELRALPPAALTLAGQPRVRLDAASLRPYLVQDLTAPKLDRLAPHLWLVATPDSRHISSLTRQGTRGRQIVLTEWPEAHLVWIDNRVFVKPLPEYLLSYDFWDSHLCVAKPGPTDIRLVKAAKGLLRSYAYLITHESDFRIAQSKDNPSQRLIPEDISYEDFCNFVLEFADLPDEEVSPRWQFGELRLARLNFWTNVLLWERKVMKERTGYDDTISRYFAPLAFIFAFFSVSLSAMQVTLGVIATDPSYSANELIRTSWRFSIASLVVVVLSLCLLVGNVLVFGLHELAYALRRQMRRRWHRGGRHT